MTQEIALMEPKEALDRMDFPDGLKAETITINRRSIPKLQRTEDGFTLRFGTKVEFPLERQEAINSIYDLTGVPKWHATHTPDTLIAPLLEHHLREQEAVLAITDDQGLQRLVGMKDLHPVLSPERTMEEIVQRYPEVQFQKVQSDGQTADVLAITHNDEKHLQELLQPGLHQFLPQGGDPFRAGFHLRFSPLGIVEPMIEPYLVRLVCLNGAIHAEYLSAFPGKGYGEGDEVWHWFRQGLDHVGGSIDEVMGKYAGMVGEEIPEGDGRILALEGMVRAARLNRPMADAMRDQAVAHPPQNMYDLYNILTYVSTHNTKNFDSQVQAMRRAGQQAEIGEHAQYCPTCHRN